MKFPSFCLVLLFILPATIFAQFEMPPLSPPATLTQRVGNTTVEVQYERPAARGREIFGALVPWGEVWRTGAGKCTRISFDQPVRIGGKHIDAGTYSLFTIPEPSQWWIILNTDTSLYGAYGYEVDRDVAVFKVPVQKSKRYYEALTIDLDFIPNSLRMYISWTNVQVSFDIETTIDSMAIAYIDSAFATRMDTNPAHYALAADYLYYQQGDMDLALQLLAYALEMDPRNGYALSVRMMIYERTKEYEKALKTLEQLRVYTDQKTLTEEEIADEHEYWDTHEARIRKKMKR